MSRGAIAYLEVRWRPYDSDGAFEYAKFPPHQGSVTINGRIDRNKQYVVEARNVGPTGLSSAWVSVNHTVAGANLPPTTPTGISVTSVADGVSVAWTSSIDERADVVYEVQRAPDISGSPGTFATISKVKGLFYTDPVTDGVNRWYRVRARDFQGLVSSFSSSVSSRGKTVADGADNSVLNVGPKILNPNFDAGDVYWNKETGWTITGGKANRVGSAGAPNAAIFNSILVPVKPAQQVMVQCILTASSANGTCAAAVRWFDASQAYISQSRGNTVTGTAGNTLSRITAAAPTNAAYASAAAVADSNTTGTYTADSFQLTLFPNNQDEVPDSATRGATSTTYLNANRPVINFGDAFHQNKNLDNIGDGAVYGRPNLNRLNAGRPTIDFSETIHSNKNLDNLADGSSYGRTTLTYLNANRPVINFGDAFHQNKNLDYVGDGTTFSRVRSGQVVDGVVQLLGSGRNAIQNPSFTQNVGGFPNSQPTLYSYIRDGWQLLSKTDTAIYPLYDPGGPGIGFIFQSGIAIAAGGSSQGSWYSAPFAVQPNATFALRLYRQIYLAQALQAGLVAVSSAAIDFYDASGAYLSTGPYYEKTGAFSNAYDVHTGTVPANARTARLQLFGILRNTSGATITTAYGNTAEPLFVSVEFVQAADLDNDVVDGSTYARIKGTELSSGVHKLTVAGSGTRIGDQRNLPQIAALNLRYKWPNAPTFTANSSGSVTFSVAATTVLMGTTGVSYNAMSVTRSGFSPGATVTFYLYFDDPDYSGGAQTLSASTIAANVYSSDGRVYVGTCTVTFPTSGSSGGGGDGGGGYCVAIDQWMSVGLQAAKIRTGDLIEVCNHLDLSTRLVPTESVDYALAPCVRVVTESGAAVVLSEDSPMVLRDGTMRPARAMQGEEVPVRRDGEDIRWERIAEVQIAGLRPVAKIRVRQHCYLAGEKRGIYLSTHNLKP